ncbi:DUF433 domain-containing protein [Anabaena azotica]|uniref:DUF433 domain-containing protein n=1 Tax=Anabaena azotica FACHB-119 TaxID=947527 RepID=A0ABR8DBZ2_9NOST|nr:DUF433 domain-containing protein [Anabaena azotica]MBD2503737.1 DUF433 domain-containing protein [Anabaena azotica FACHB-119]
MSPISTDESAIIRTERGLTIAGTRITLYQLMDYIHQGYTPDLIRNYFYITNEQFREAMSYIETHRAEVEAEYQSVLQQAQEIREYWEEQNKKRLADVDKLTPKAEYKAAWEKLQARKAKRASSN